MALLDSVTAFLGIASLAPRAWVEISERDGLALWSASLAKGQSATSADGGDVVAIPQGMAVALGLTKAAIGGAYTKRVPTGKFRTKKGGGQGAQIYRYFYSDESAAQAAKEGEHVNLRGKGGTHEVVASDHDGVTLRHAKTGEDQRLTHDELHERMAKAHGKKFERGAESLLRKYLKAAEVIKASPDDPSATFKELAPRFKSAGVDREQAMRLVAFLAERKGWDGGAKKALLALASDPEIGKTVAPRARQIAKGAENLSRADGSKEVGSKHVGQATIMRAPAGGFDAAFADTRNRVAAELAKTEALLGAIEATGANAALKKTMVDHANHVLGATDGHELERMVTAFPGLRETPEWERLHAARSKWDSIRAERDSDRKPDNKGFTGSETTVYVSDAEGNPTPQKARYRLIEASDAIASHDPVSGFTQRKDYPEGVQERSYHRDKAEQEKVRRNAQKLQPAYVVNTNPDAVNGPPVMTADGIVLGGNSRTMSMQLAYDQHPDMAKNLKDHLRDNAHSFGFAKGDVDAMKNPILVREVDIDDTSKGNMGVLVRRYNESFTQGMDPRVDQVARGRMVTQGMVDSLASGMGKTNDAGEPLHATLNSFLGSSDGARFVSELSSAREGKSIIDRRNRSQYVGKDGKLNEDGKTFVERVLVGHVIPDPDLLSDMLPKNVSAVATVVPHIVAAAAKGHDVKGAMKDALGAYAYMRRKGLADVDEYDRDSGGFASLGIEGFEQKPKLDTVGKALLGVFVDRIDKPVQLASFFREFAKHARANPAGQSSLLGESENTETLLKRAASQSKQGQRDMFKATTMHTTWVNVSSDFGDYLWSTSLAKAAMAITAHDGSEVIALPTAVAKALNPDMLAKAGAVGGTYVKRVPTGKFRTKKGGGQGAQIYRYYYGVQHGGGVLNKDDFKTGTAFKHGDGELKIHGVKDGKLAVSHSKTPDKMEHITHAELSSRLEKEHGAKVRDERKALEKRLHAELEEAKQYGSEKHIKRLVDEMKRRGVTPPGGKKTWEEWGSRPKDVRVDFTGHPAESILKDLPTDRFTSVKTKLVGAESGKGDDRKVYGDALRQDNVVFGFDYGRIAADSLMALDAMTVDKVYDRVKGKKAYVKGQEVAITKEDVEAAMDKMRQSLQDTLAGAHDKETGQRPLIIDGKPVKGVKVYRGDGDVYTGPKGNPPLPGTIYMHGIKVHSIELEPPTHGPKPESKSSPIVAAGEALKNMLPIGSYRAYRLDPDKEWKVNFGTVTFTNEDVLSNLNKGGRVLIKAGDPFDLFDPFDFDGYLEPDENGVIDLGAQPDESESLQKGTVSWVPMLDGFGDHLWSMSLRKGGVSTRADGVEVMQLPWSIVASLDPKGLFKAGKEGGKYIKRIPTGNPKRPWRYFYAVQHGGGVANREHFKEGATFKHGEGHLKIHGMKDGKLIVHHADGKQERMSHDELEAKLKEHHGEAIGKHREKLTKEHAEAVAAGNEKGAKRIRDEAAKVGHEIAEPKKAKPKAEKEAITEPEKAKPDEKPSTDTAKPEPKNDAELSHKFDTGHVTHATWERTTPAGKDERGRVTAHHKNGKTEQRENVHRASFEFVKDGGLDGNHGAAMADLLDAHGGPKADKQEKPVSTSGSDNGEKPIALHEYAYGHTGGVEKDGDGYRATWSTPSDRGSMRFDTAKGANEKFRDIKKYHIDRINKMTEDAPAAKPALAPTASEGEKAKAPKAEKAPKKLTPDVKPISEAEAQKNRDGFKPTETPTATHEERIQSAKDTYGLKGKEHDRLDAHDHTKKAKEHAEKGEHDKADRYVREAVKDVLYRSSGRNMSPSSAEKYMKGKEGKAAPKKVLKGTILDALDTLIVPLFKSEMSEEMEQVRGIVYNKPRPIRDGEPGFGEKKFLVHAKAPDGRIRVIRFNKAKMRKANKDKPMVDANEAILTSAYWSELA